LNDLRRHATRLLDEVSVMGRSSVAGLPLAVWWRGVGRSDVQARQVLMQTSVRWTSRTVRARLRLDHHRTTGGCASSARWCMIETFNTGQSSDLTGSRLLRHGRPRLVRRLSIHQATGCWTLSVARIGAGMPGPPPELEFRLGVSATMREDGACWAGVHTTLL
jgi:hypothetical protein